MKQKRIVLVAAIMLVVFGALPAAADFYVIPVSGKVGTQITSLPYTINSPGLYCLSRSLTYSATSGSAITVNIGDVTLDLMGFSLTGPGKYSGGTGILISGGLSNVEIRNGTVNNFGNIGIEGSNVYGVRLIGLRVMDNGDDGALLGGNNHMIMGCSFISNLDGGAYLLNAGGCLIKDNLASGNGSSGLVAGEGSTVSGNVCRANSNYGIYVYSSAVLDNTVLSSVNYGIYASEGSTVMRNTSRANIQVGIFTGANCVVKNNTTQGMTNGSDCTLVDNQVY